MLFYLAADSVWLVAVLTNWDPTHIKIFEKEIYLLKADRKVPDIDRIWNLLRFTISNSLKLIKHNLLSVSETMFHSKDPNLFCVLLWYGY